MKEGFGGINLNNMMPIPKKSLYEIDISKIEDTKYKRMLYMQIEWIEKNKLRINNRAKNLYYLVIKNKVTEKLKQRCCNFKLLEIKCQDYMDSNKMKEEEIYYNPQL